MEFFDICDENGNPTGETIERSEAHARGVCHRTVHIWIVRQNEGRTEILLQKRSADKDAYPGKYDTSSAGHVQAGDEPTESACRELAEELGIHARPEELDFGGNFRIRYEAEFYGKPFRDNEVVFLYVCRRPVALSDLTLQAEEVEGADWFDLEETYQACARGEDWLCVPLNGLKTLKRYLNERRAEA